MDSSGEWTDRSRISRLQWLYISCVFFSALIAIAIWWCNQPSESFRESVRLSDVIESLAKRRPPDMEPSQWERAVGWTINLDGNSLTHLADATAIRSLREQLERKLESDVDMETIGWIWDSYAELCTSGKRYQRFRQRMLDEIAEGGGNWSIDAP